MHNALDEQIVSSFMYRRTISEIVSLYLLEPTLADIWVEGPSDQWLISWYLSQTVGRSVEVKTISDVEVGREVVEHYGLNFGK